MSCLTQHSVLSTMFFRQHYLGCLAHASYFIASNGEAAVVDPQRDVDLYLDEARREGVAIRYVIETHLHADFVSGHRELAARSGAEIVFGASAGAAFPHRAVRDGDVLPLGSIELRALETPGHTPESISWLVVERGRPTRILTGDTLFIGDVGRPDLAGARGYTPRAMAAMLYDSLHGKLLALPDDVEVWPAHGAGSACGRNISTETSSTIGVQRRPPIVVVAASAARAREAAMRLARVGIESVSGYLVGTADLPTAATPQLSVDELAASSLPVIDVRREAEYAAGHVPAARNLPLAELPRRIDEVPRETKVAVICAGGYRSIAAASFLA